MTKKVAFGPKSTAQGTNTPTADEWVASKTSEETKRLTLDIPATLHKRIKAACALKGIKMVDEIRSLLEERFPA